jgi:signal transduction histidine kinase
MEMERRPVITHSRGRNGALLSLLMSALLGLLAAGLFVYWRSPMRGLPYQDSFARGEAQEWQAFGGTWGVVNGSMRNDSDERGAKLLTGSTHWQDYSIEGDVMLLGLGGDAGFVVRSSDEEEGVDAYRGYYAGLRTLDNSLVLGRAGYGWIEVNFPLKPRKEGVQVSRWYHLKFLAYGCRLVATAGTLSDPSSTVTSITDEDCIRTGRVGLRSYSGGGVWRNVVVRKATQVDVTQMLAQGHAGPDSSIEHPLSELPALGVSLAPPPGNQPQSLPFSPDTQSISDLKLLALAAPIKATIRGIVVLTSPALFVQDPTGGVAVHRSAATPLKVGDEVEVTGEVHASAFSLAIENAVVHLLWEGTPMPAVSVTASQVAAGNFDAAFIEVEGRLRSKEYGQNDTVILNLDAGPQSFRAIISRSRAASLYELLKTNSLVRLRGVAVVDPAFTANMTPFAVLLRSTEDVQVLAGPPWWSVRHLVAIGISLLILGLIANFLYHLVENWRLRAVVEERERLAYEMHDTLAQSVAGIGFQLEAIRIGTPPELLKVHEQLDLASELVRHSHVEARRSVDMLRPRQLASEGLLGALTSCARRLVAGGSVEVVATSRGDVRPLSLRTADTLYRIGQEALANAVRHAHPSKLTIHLDYERDAVRLLIGDDGSGFVEGQNQAGLGVLAMHKRASSISAELEIQRNQGPGSEDRGTLVSVTAFLPPPVTFFSWPLLLWKIFRERTRDATSKPHPHPYRG